MTSFVELTQSKQIALLEEFAHNILNQYDFQAATIECVNHAYNTTFKIISEKNQEFALRINSNSTKSPHQILAEVQWLEALSTIEQINTPIPIPTLDNSLFSSAYFAPSDMKLNAVLLTWMSGEEIRDDPTDTQLFALGTEHGFSPPTRENLATTRFGKFTSN